MNGEHVDTHEGALTYLDKAKQGIQSANDLLTLRKIHDRLSAVNPLGTLRVGGSPTNYRRDRTLISSL